MGVGTIGIMAGTTVAMIDTRENKKLQHCRQQEAALRILLPKTVLPALPLARCRCMAARAWQSRLRLAEMPEEVLEQPWTSAESRQFSETDLQSFEDVHTRGSYWGRHRERGPDERSGRYS